MKKLLFVIAIVSLLLLPTAAWADDEGLLDYVDIGDPTSEAGHRLKRWGPIEPATSGGIYGGIDDCRVTWEPGGRDTKWARSASFVMRVPTGFRATHLVLKVLDGLADDSFIVRVNYKKVYEYRGLKTGSEDWITHTIPLDSVSGFRRRRIRVVVTATGPPWEHFDTYGQLAVDEAKLLGYQLFESLDLYEKDPATWERAEGGAWGRLTYRTASPTFDFTFHGHRLEPRTEYSLIYFAGPWPGNHPGALIASGKTTRRGHIFLMGRCELDTDIPNPADENYPDGGKIWLVRSSDYDATAKAMTAWHHTDILFEDHLITYDDTEMP